MGDQQLIDGFQRQVTYLRLSVTDRCNFRCTYCMPENGIQPLPQNDLLTFEEITKIVSVLAQVGINRVRVTGGEPLVRRGIPTLVERLVQIDGIEEVVMTTNGQLLPRYADDLANAGLTAVTISLDSLRPARFADITRGADLDGVLAGLHAAQEAKIPNIKLNAVIIRGFNDDELLELTSFSIEHNVALRFIEFMPIGNAPWAEKAFMAAEEIRSELEKRYQLEDEGASPHHGPARYWRLSGGDAPSQGHQIGIIAAVSECFCSQCNRARLTAHGGFRVCLADEREVSFRELLRSGANTDELIQAAQMALGGKRDKRDFGLGDKSAAAAQMVRIGG